MSSSIKKISFPKEEIPLVKNQEEIVTHRVSKDFSKYQLGDEVLSPWGDIYLVVDRIEVSSIKDSPYLQFLTAGQKDEISKYGDVAILTLRKVQANPAIEIRESAAKYEPPYSLDVIQKVYGNDVYNRLKDDPVHRWRAETGIELIHKEPTKDEFERIVANWNLMTPEQKAKSDEKSNELFGNNNERRIDLLRKEYDFKVGDKVRVRKGLRCIQSGHDGTIVRINPPETQDYDSHGWSSFVVKFDDPKFGTVEFQSGNIDKINETTNEFKTLSSKKIADGNGGLAQWNDVFLNNNKIGRYGLSFYDDEKAIGIGDLEVFPEFRNNGYGTKIINDIVDKYKNDYDKIYCYVDKDNFGAINLYKRIGKVNNELNSNGQYYVEFYNKKLKENIQGLEQFSNDELKQFIMNGIHERMNENNVSDSDATILNMAIIGSRTKNKAKDSSDLDVVVEYSGRLREDDFFNILHSDTEESGSFEINGIAIDVNPIRKEESGTLKEYLKKSNEYWEKMNSKFLTEAGLIVNKKDGAYPKNNNVLIMAGGSGSGKSFILNKLILFEGKVFNPDITLEMLIEYAKRKPNSKLCKKFLADTNKNLADINVKISDEAGLVYSFISKYKLQCEKEACFFKALQAIKTKPNVIFDVTLKDIKTVEWISKYAKLGGYDPENVNLVWVLNDMHIAMDQNAKRTRMVEPEYLKQVHVGAAKTVLDIIESSNEWQKTINGDIWIVFNKRGVDVKITTHLNRISDKDNEYRANSVIDDYVAIHLKERGQPAKNIQEIEKPIIDKILSYIPDEAKKYWKQKLD